jgi:D-serine deaminase-like pyridoxal phosphate-dependent protein
MAVHKGGPLRMDQQTEADLDVCVQWDRGAGRCATRDVMRDVAHVGAVSPIQVLLGPV